MPPVRQTQSLVLREGSLLLHEPFHRACFFRRYVLIGVRHAPEEIGKRRKDTSTVGLEVIQSVECLTKRRERLLLRRLYSQPSAACSVRLQPDLLKGWARAASAPRASSARYESRDSRPWIPRQTE